MELKDWLVVLSTLLSPLIAVQVTEYLNRRRQSRDEQMRMFRTLMATRASTHLKNQSYYPQGYGDLEAEQSALRRATFEIVSGKRPLPMWVANLPPQPGGPPEPEPSKVEPDRQ